jgi:hypothetical protein
MKGMGVLAKTIYNEELDELPEEDETSEVVRQRNERLLQLWLSLGENLITLWSLIEQHQDFSNLHRASNIFMDQWIKMCGTKQMTNYVHIIDSGHLTYFAKRYGNLYRYFQQGWEALNQLLKHYYFNNTNHSGSYRNGGTSTDSTYSCATVSGDHCQPLMRLCQRSLL